jgi:hypothetical protein
MKNLHTYEKFRAINEATMVVDDFKINDTASSAIVTEFVTSHVTPKMKKNFEKTTGLKMDVPLKEITAFLKEQLKYVNPVLYKKDLSQAEFDKMCNDLLQRVDTFISKKAEEYLEKMPFKIKSALSFIPESTLKKEIQDQNKDGDSGLIEQIIQLIGDFVVDQKLDGDNAQEDLKFRKVLNPKPQTYKISATKTNKCGGWIMTDPNSKKEVEGQTFADRGNLFYEWILANTFEGKKLVNHYIDLIVPILA